VTSVRAQIDPERSYLWSKLPFQVSAQQLVHDKVQLRRSSYDGDVATSCSATIGPLRPVMT
jgi:hypothetical protein